MPFVSIAGERIYYTHHVGGDEALRPTLLLVHGAGGSRLHWPPSLRRLEGVHVYALDLPGHGRSRGKGRSSIAEYREVVARFLEALGLTEVVVTGHSMGGAIALSMALDCPHRLAGLILVGTGARLRVTPLILEGIREDFEGTVRLIIEYAHAPDAPARLKRKGFRQMANTPPEVLLGDFRACDAFDVMERLGAIHLPTLIICGNEDRLTPPKYSLYLRDHIPQARLTMVEGAGHMVMLERAEEVTRAINAFLVALDASLTGG